MHGAAPVRILLLLAGAMGFQYGLTLLQRIRPHRDQTRTSRLYYRGILLATTGLAAFVVFNLLRLTTTPTDTLWLHLVDALAFTALPASLYYLIRVNDKVLRHEQPPPGAIDERVRERLQELLEPDDQENP